MAKATNIAKDADFSYWNEQVEKATKRYEDFVASGKYVIDKYRIEQAANNVATGSSIARAKGQDRYNILYSSTETIKPSLYAKTPKIEVQKRHRDRKNTVVSDAVKIMETCVAYGIQEVDFDEAIQNAVEDYTLPGLGQTWLRYEATMKDETKDGEPVYGKDGKTPNQLVDFEALGFDYVNWQDFLMGPARTWSEVPWVARRVYKSKSEVAARWGKEKAEKVGYSNHKNTRGSGSDDEGPGNQAMIWEIYVKKGKQVLWYCPTYTDGLLEKKDDFLKLKKFFPCPKPLRAISNTKTMVPRCFFSQYQAQAEEIDNLTKRIRILTDALKVVGIYNGSIDELKKVLTGDKNQMVAVENWAGFAQDGGLKGSVEWLPIKDVAAVLMQLLQARDVAKSEVYEITGFGDILRGVSKASETLGAQEIKTDWASSRLKVMQREVQRFCRDNIRMMAEIICEHFQEETLALYSGFDANAEPDLPQMGHNGGPPMPVPPEQMEMQKAALLQKFRAAVDLLKSERDRCAVVDIETDSTILPDEQKERADRLEFLGQIGAFMQQAGPMLQQFPDMRGLLGALMMFSVRTFTASRPVEMEFEKFQSLLDAMPPTDPNAKAGADGAAQAQAAMQTAQLTAQTTMQAAQLTAQSDKYKVDVEAQLAATKEQNRHAEAMAGLQLETQRVQLEMRKLEVQAADMQTKNALEASSQQQEATQAAQESQRADRQQEHAETKDMASHGLAERAQEASENEPKNDA